MIVFIILLILLFVLFLKSGEKTVKKALESDRIFLPFDDSIHQTPPQQDRIKRAVEQNLKVKTLLSNGYSGKIIGTTGNVYLVTLKIVRVRISSVVRNLASICIFWPLKQCVVTFRK